MTYDVIVVGAGHAGVEAAMAAAKSGCRVLIATTNLDRVAYMSCNPSIGGLAKGHMVRELDILGGQMGHNADGATIQFKRLNAKKGPAVRGSRSQCDKDLYSSHMKERLLSQPGLEVLQSEVKALLLEGNICCGVVLEGGSEIRSRTVVITTGTFMKGVMYIGQERIEGGRVGDNATVGLSDQLAAFGFSVRRLKTGTPPRLEKGSVNWQKLEPQKGDERFVPFSFRSEGRLKYPEILCYLSRTTEQTHDIIRQNLHLSPMFSGEIEGHGPRYCPSIEDKITRFADKDNHQTFLEPEGLNTEVIYLQGISTCLPREVQDQFLRTIPGLEDVKILRYGYAVEYDFVEPTQLDHSLETRAVENLFLAGQINGTSGYEEAAVQGFVAGVNAVRRIREEEPFVLDRHEAYIGVLIDDLVTKGTREPYRMFTSRAEHRLVLREDNTSDRMLEKSRRLGLLEEREYDYLESLSRRRKNLLGLLKEKKVYPNAATQNILKQLGTPILTKPLTFHELMRRSEIQFNDLRHFAENLETDVQVTEPVEIDVKYEGYVKRQIEVIEQAKKLENMALSPTLDYWSVHGLSNEEKEKLQTIRPRSIGQARRISGVNPSAIQALMVHLKGRRRRLRELQDG